LGVSSTALLPACLSSLLLGTVEQTPPAQEWSARRPAVASLVFVLVRAARDAAQFRRVYELLAALCTLLSLDELPLHSCQLPLSAAVPDRIRQCLAGGLGNTSSRCRHLDLLLFRWPCTFTTPSDSRLSLRLCMLKHGCSREQAAIMRRTRRRRLSRSHTCRRRSCGSSRRRC